MRAFPGLRQTSGILYLDVRDRRRPLRCAGHPGSVEVKVLPREIQAAWDGQPSIPNAHRFLQEPGLPPLQPERECVLAGLARTRQRILVDKLSIDPYLRIIVRSEVARYSLVPVRLDIAEGISQPVVYSPIDLIKMKNAARSGLRMLHLSGPASSTLIRVRNLTVKCNFRLSLTPDSTKIVFMKAAIRSIERVS